MNVCVCVVWNESREIGTWIMHEIEYDYKKNVFFIEGKSERVARAKNPPTNQI